MSKPKIKFIYTGQFRSEVFDIFMARLRNFKKDQQSFKIQYMQIQNNQQSTSNAEIISKMDVNSKPNSPIGMNRHKSSENFYIKKDERQQKLQISVNIQQNASETLTFNNKTYNIEKQKDDKNDQIIINAPSYKFLPKKEGQISVFSQKQILKNGVIQKNLKCEQRFKQKKHINNSNNEQDFQQKSQNPLLKLQAIKQQEFKTNYDSQINTTFLQDKILIKAPAYKFAPCQEGSLVVNRKKQYSKTENKQKYFYPGIQTRKQTQFISCFDCKQPKAKKYKIEES